MKHKKNYSLIKHMDFLILECYTIRVCISPGGKIPGIQWTKDMEGVIMTKVDIYSGFLRAGKTTLIKKMIAEGYKGQKLVLIENEFGEIGIDGGFLQDAGINITEMNSGCICCSLVGAFGKALEKVIADQIGKKVEVKMMLQQDAGVSQAKLVDISIEDKIRQQVHFDYIEIEEE